MIKRALLAGFAILVAWTLTDVVLHRVVLQTLYDERSGLWRPMNELSVPLIYAVTLLLIGCIVVLYQMLVAPKSFGAGLAFGGLLGFALGVAVGFGTYIHMPIPLALAWGWFLGAIAKGVLAGGVVGLLLKGVHESDPPALSSR